MKNIFKIVITILMAILILILIWVLVKYYKDDPFTATPSTVTVVTPMIPTENDDNSITNGNDSVDAENSNQEVNNLPDESVQIDNNFENNSNEEDITNKENRNTPKPYKPVNKPTENEPVVISSSEKTSNAEKQEVLNEIDKALMDLLQVVDKVQTIDETRLGIDESEVQ